MKIQEDDVQEYLKNKKEQLELKNDQIINNNKEFKEENTIKEKPKSSIFAILFIIYFLVSIILMIILADVSSELCIATFGQLIFVFGLLGFTNKNNKKSYLLFCLLTGALLVIIPLLFYFKIIDIKKINTLIKDEYYFIAIGALIIIISLSLLIKKFIIYPIKIKATIISFRKEDQSSIQKADASLCAVDAKYEFEGKEYIYNSTTYVSNSKRKVGDTIKLRINKNDVNKAVSANMSPYIFVSLLGLFFIIIALFTL